MSTSEMDALNKRIDDVIRELKNQKYKTVLTLLNEPVYEHVTGVSQNPVSYSPVMDKIQLTLHSMLGLSDTKQFELIERADHNSRIYLRSILIQAVTKEAMELQNIIMTCLGAEVKHKIGLYQDKGKRILFFGFISFGSRLPDGVDRMLTIYDNIVVLKNSNFDDAVNIIKQFVKLQNLLNKKAIAEKPEDRDPMVHELYLNIKANVDVMLSEAKSTFQFTKN